jgi:ankyrin repeat protein
VDTNREVVDYLLAHGATHNISSAVATGDAEAIRQLVSRTPADLEKRMDLTNRRRRPLHLAVIKKQPHCLATLLDLGANTESLDEAGFTALDQAALAGETMMAHMLLDGGAKIRLPAAVCLGKRAMLSDSCARIRIRSSQADAGPILFCGPASKPRVR